MKLKQLHELMQDIAPFANPKIELEQFPTGPHLASRMLYTVATSYDEFLGQNVVDLGCGTGMLSIGAAILGASHVIGIDIDSEALEIAAANIDEFEKFLPVDLVLCSVQDLAKQSLLRADTVIMNPPFGTRRKGADMDFLRAAFGIATHSIYSLHKTSTRQYISRVALREFGAVQAEVLAELRYDLPASYSYHKMQSKDIAVDLWRFVVRPQASTNEMQNNNTVAKAHGTKLLHQRHLDLQEDDELRQGKVEDPSSTSSDDAS